MKNYATYSREAFLEISGTGRFLPRILHTGMDEASFKDIRVFVWEREVECKYQFVVVFRSIAFGSILALRY
jgi:hypothetical protein